MTNSSGEERLKVEINSLLEGQKSLMLATRGSDDIPYASYAPFAVNNDRIFVLLSDIAIHGVNLQQSPKASVLVIEDESQARQLFARVRVNYRVEAQLIEQGSADWDLGLGCLSERHGKLIMDLSAYDDFHLFALQPLTGRFIRGYGQAYTITGNTLAGESLDRLRDGHVKRSQNKTADPATEAN